MFTPSYSIGGLAVLAADKPPFSSDGQVSNSKQSFFPTSSPPSIPNLQVSSPSAPKPILPQYHKLKMNYFRKLNVIPIISPEDVLHAKDEAKEFPEQSHPSKRNPKSKKPFLFKKKTKSENDEDNFQSEFVPSFLPVRSQPSDPILIPHRTRSPPSSLSSSDLEDLHPEEEQSTSYVSGASLGAQSSVAEEMTPDHFGVFFPSFEL
jgi:hypothetical protein